VDGTISEGASAVDEFHGDRRTHAGRKKHRGQSYRWNAEHQRQFSSLRRSVSAAKPCSRKSWRLVSEAQRSRAPLQRLADRVAAYFVPTVIVVAILSFAGWILFGPEPRFAHALVAAVSVLIIACPCALGLSDADVHHGCGWSRRARSACLYATPKRWKRSPKLTPLS